MCRHHEPAREVSQPPPDQVRRRVQPVARADRLADVGELVSRGRVAQKTVDRAVELGVGEAVRIEADAVAQFGHALGVVVLVPEQRQQDHGLAEVEGLGGRVVAAVGDDEIDQRKDPGLRQVLLAPHVRSQFDLLVHRAPGDDVAVRGPGE